jgi:hypothetical protein
MKRGAERQLTKDALDDDDDDDIEVRSSFILVCLSSIVPNLGNPRPWSRLSKGR